MLRVTILYEDSIGVGIKEFGPHNLVTQCIADQLGRSAWELRKHVFAETKNGVDKLLAALRRDMENYASRVSRVFAVVDGDDVREHLKLKPSACRTLIVTKIKACPSPHLLDVVLLERNIETVLSALRTLSPSLVPGPDWTLAIEKKKLMKRDLILNRVAMNPAHIELRARLLEAVPSFARLVTRVAKDIA